MFGKFLNCGQTCVAPDYVLVHRSKKDALIQALQNEIVKQYGEHPLTSDIYGKIIHPGQFERIRKMMDPDKIVYGGTCDEKACKIEPAIMDDVTWDDSVMQEEIFGPLLPVLTYDDFDEMMDTLKTKPHPLAFYLFTRNIFKKWIQK